MEELLTLPGVGRKTANLVLILAHRSTAEHLCGYPRAPHFEPARAGSTTRTPDETEHALYKAAHRKWWPVINLYLVTWGQNVCRPVYPLCDSCVDHPTSVRRIGVAKVEEMRSNEGHCWNEGLEGHEGGAVVVLVAVLRAWPAAAGSGEQKSPGAGPIIVLETDKGTIEFETYPEEAPKTVARIVELGEEGLLQRSPVSPRRAEVPDPGRRPAVAQHGDAGLVGARAGIG